MTAPLLSPHAPREPAPSANDVGERSIDLMAAAYEALPIAAVVVARAGEAVWMNAAARALVPIRRAHLDAHHEDLALRGLDGTPLPPDELPLARALRGERVEAKVRVRAAGERTWTIDANPIFRGGNVVGAVALYRDVTERALDDEMADDLLGTAAHDLRTPLTALKACAQLVERGLDRLEPAARARTLTLLVGQVDRLSARIDDVLDASRIRRGRFDVREADADLGAELARVSTELKSIPAAPPLEIAVPEGILVRVDPARLRQIVRSIALDGERPFRVEARIEGPVVILEMHGSLRASARTRTARRLAFHLERRLSADAPASLSDDDKVLRITLPRAAPHDGASSP